MDDPFNYPTTHESIHQFHNFARKLTRKNVTVMADVRPLNPTNLNLFLVLFMQLFVRFYEREQRFQKFMIENYIRVILLIRELFE
jgi:hypothetical protein